DASGAMAVAAINQANWTTGPQENFSSQGPTNDGRTKPDISGPDGVSTFTYGTASFYGTSASSPYVAGAASLVLSAYPGFTASQLQSTLEGWAVDMGVAGKDSIYGSGRLNLALPILEVDPTSLVFGEVEVPQAKTLTFRAYNAGTGTLSGTVSDDRDWITVNPTSFSGNDNTISVTVHTDIMALEFWKTYTGTVTVVSNGGTKTVEISFTPTCVRVYPNPFILSQHEKLTFWGTGIPGAEVRIYTLSGKLVKTLYETMGKNKLYWDGRNKEGDLVSSGIYLYVVISPKEKNTGKFAVINK
ncbi:T9SS type A sorting domain-containing protein, partial [Candidatus Aerophobetes bacterium]